MMLRSTSGEGYAPTEPARFESHTKARQQPGRLSAGALCRKVYHATGMIRALATHIAQAGLTTSFFDWFIIKNTIG